MLPANHEMRKIFVPALFICVAFRRVLLSFYELKTWMLCAITSLFQKLLELF